MDPRVEARMLAAARGLTNFEFLGELPNEQVLEQLERARVLVSTSEFEGLPNTFIEAWLRGVPVVSGRVDPDGLIARHGLGCVAEDPEELSRQVELRLGDDELWRAESRRCREVACELFDVERIVDRVVALALGQHGPGVADPSRR
jgi:glycosyltransferase involved in cell wall biosynthesis